MATDPLESLQPLPAAARYGSGAIAFHWSMFVLVVVVGILGLLHDDWPKQTQAFWINVHAMIGLLLWCLLIARIGWRIRHAPPDLPADVGALSRRSSKLVHWALYFLLFIKPLAPFLFIVSTVIVYHPSESLIFSFFARSSRKDL